MTIRIDLRVWVNIFVLARGVKKNQIAISNIAKLWLGYWCQYKYSQIIIVYNRTNDCSLYNFEQRHANIVISQVMNDSSEIGR